MVTYNYEYFFENGSSALVSNYTDISKIKRFKKSLLFTLYAENSVKETKSYSIMKWMSRPS